MLARVVTVNSVSVSTVGQGIEQGGAVQSTGTLHGCYERMVTIGMSRRAGVCMWLRGFWKSVAVECPAAGLIIGLGATMDEGMLTP